MRHVLAASLGAALLLPGPARPQERSLSLQEALELARTRAAAVIAATGRVEEARARLFPAARRLRENPVVEVEGGRRRAEETFTDYAVALSQGFEPASRRRARIAGAEAAVETARAELDDTRRLYLGEVARAFFHAAAAVERLRIARLAAEVGDDLLATIERRAEMGETTALELNRARTSAARARAEREAAAADRLAAGGLGALLGLGPSDPLSPVAELSMLPVYDLDALLRAAAERPDLQALAAAEREAEAQVRLGEALARPDFAVRTGVEREEGADIVLAGVAVALPLAQRGQEERAVGTARAAFLRAQLDAARRAAETEVRAAFAAYETQRRAAEELARTALPAIDDNVALARRSFEVGEIDLGELLLVRREILETRLAHLDLLLAARLVGVELETAAGVVR
ncbi:MAG TPA: TolC family protein [Thermoanaerobaculia bacterium]|nr:TolC family protein [Thermoanaerobaculia bacterium]